MQKKIDEISIEELDRLIQLKRGESTHLQYSMSQNESNYHQMKESVSWSGASQIVLNHAQITQSESLHSALKDLQTKNKFLENLNEQLNEKLSNLKSVQTKRN